MDNADEILNKIIDWAKGEELIKGVVMVGSRALEQSDDLSDIDISIFAKDIDPFVKDDSWISKISNVWVYSPDKYYFEDILVPTRLVIYERGDKVDFSLWNTDATEKLGQSGFFDTGFKILLDKDGGLANFKKPSLKPKLPKKPTEEEFIHLINEFWFEAYHIAKYLKRDDLWLVKNVDRVVKKHLLTMMEWYTLAKNNWEMDVKWLGKNIKNWLEVEIYNKLNNTFAHFDSEDSWKALISSSDLFRDLSKQSAKMLGYTYPEEVDKNLTGFINKLHSD